MILYQTVVLGTSKVIRCMPKGVTFLRELRDCGILDEEDAISTDMFHSFHC